jgi:hypothetical protein
VAGRPAGSDKIGSQQIGSQHAHDTQTVPGDGGGDRVSGIGRRDVAGRPGGLRRGRTRARPREGPVRPGHRAHRPAHRRDAPRPVRCRTCLPRSDRKRCPCLCRRPEAGCARKPAATPTTPSFRPRFLKMPGGSAPGGSPISWPHRSTSSTASRVPTTPSSSRRGRPCRKRAETGDLGCSCTRRQGLASASRFVNRMTSRRRCGAAGVGASPAFSCPRGFRSDPLRRNGSRRPACRRR